MSEDITKLKQKISESKQSLRKMRFQNAMGQLDDTSKLSKTKKEVARMMTQLSVVSKNDVKQTPKAGVK